MTDKQWFYLGVCPCGCVAAVLVDPFVAPDPDPDVGKARDAVIAFYQRMMDRQYHVSHACLSRAEFQQTVTPCRCLDASAARIPALGALSRMVARLGFALERADPDNPLGREAFACLRDNGVEGQALLPTDHTHPALPSLGSTS